MINPPVTIFCIVYFVAAFLSFFICIPMGINSTNYGGKCILFATGNWSNSDKTLNVNWGRDTYCNFGIFTGVASLLVSLGLLWKSVKLVCRELQGTPFYSFMRFVTNSLMMLCLFTTAFVISLGHSAWCQLLLTGGSNGTCVDVDLTQFDKEHNVRSGEFSKNLGVAEFGAWSSSLVWLAACLLSFFKVRYFHKNAELLQELGDEKDTLIPHRQKYGRIGDDSDIVT